MGREIASAGYRPPEILAALIKSGAKCGARKSVEGDRSALQRSGRPVTGVGHPGNQGEKSRVACLRTAIRTGSLEGRRPLARCDRQKVAALGWPFFNSRGI